MLPFRSPVGPSLSIPGFAIGHGTDPIGRTGVTVILCPDGAVAAAEVRGTAAGTRQFDSLVSPLHVARRAHAVVLSGGSGFGLAAADPVIDWLAARGYGFVTGVAPVPLVPTAILFDLGFSEVATRPRTALVESALASASWGVVPVGSVGAGTGATVGKALGLPSCMKGGFGFASLTSETGLTVAAAVAVNPFGDVRDPLGGHILAGSRTQPDGLEFADSARVLASLPPDARSAWESNTTLAVVMTDAVLTKPEAAKVSQMAFGAFYRTLSPALTLYDGDLVVTLAIGRTPAHLHQVGILAEQAVAEAILIAVREADGFGIVPGVRDLVAGAWPRAAT
jgi:L-aminopeptidase/D-esterase-like protein